MCGKLTLVCHETIPDFVSDRLFESLDRCAHDFSFVIAC
jgi:hypothetical protein